MARPALSAEIYRGISAAAAPITNFHGSARGTQASDGLLNGGTPPGFISYSGHGSANAKVGGFLFGNMQRVITNPANPSSVTIADGRAMLITDARGDHININYTGTGTVVRGGRTTFTLTGTVVNGTGWFNAAQGTFTATGTVSGHRIGFQFNVHLTRQ